MKLSEAAKEFLTWQQRELLRVKGYYSQHTHDNYERALRGLQKGLGDVRVETITQGQVEQYLADFRASGAAGRTHNQRLMIFRAFWKWLKKAHGITNAVDEIAKAREEPKESYPAARSEAETILNQIGPDGNDPRSVRDWVFVETMAIFGLRISDALRLDVSGVRFTPSERRKGDQALTLSVRTKGNKEWSVTVAIVGDRMARYAFHLQHLLAIHRNGTWNVAPTSRSRDALFLGSPRSGAAKRMTRSSMSDRFSRYAAKAGAPHVTPHTLRHGAATTMLSNGVDVVTVQHVLNHGSPQTTLKIYGHTDKAKMGQAIVTCAEAK